MKLNKNGFSLIEVMLILLAISLIIAASASLISRNSTPISEGIQHGTFRCLGVPHNYIINNSNIPENIRSQYQTDYNRFTNDELSEEERTHVYLQELYGVNRNTPISSRYTTQCEFSPSKEVPLFHIDLYGAGAGGSDYFSVEKYENTSEEDTEDTYTLFNDGEEQDVNFSEYASHQIVDVKEKNPSDEYLKIRKENNNLAERAGKNMPQSISDILKESYLTYSADFGRGGKGASVELKNVLDISGSSCHCLYKLTAEYSDIHVLIVRNDYETYDKFLEELGVSEDQAKTNSKKTGSELNAWIDKLNGNNGKTYTTKYFSNREACSYSNDGATYGYVWACSPTTYTYYGGEGGAYDTTYSLKAYYPLSGNDVGDSAENGCNSNPLEFLYNKIKDSATKWSEITSNNKKEGTEYDSSVDAWGRAGGKIDNAVVDILYSKFQANYYEDANNGNTENLANISKNPLYLFDALVMDTRHNARGFDADRIEICNIVPQNPNNQINTDSNKNVLANRTQDRFSRYGKESLAATLISHLNIGYGALDPRMGCNSSECAGKFLYSPYGQSGSIPVIRVSNQMFGASVEQNDKNKNLDFNVNSNKICAATGGGPTKAEMNLFHVFYGDNATENVKKVATSNDVLDDLLGYLVPYVSLPREKDNDTVYQPMTGEYGLPPAFVTGVKDEDGKGVCRRLSGLEPNDIKAYFSPYASSEKEQVHAVRSITDTVNGELNSANTTADKEEVFRRHKIPFEKIIGGEYGDDSRKINLSVKFKSTPTYLRYTLGPSGGNGTHESYTKTDIGERCTFQISGGGLAHVVESGGYTRPMETGMSCFNGEDVIFSATAKSGSYRTPELFGEAKETEKLKLFWKGLYEIPNSETGKQNIKYSIDYELKSPYETTQNVFYKGLIDFLKTRIWKENGTEDFAKNDNIGKGGEGIAIYDNCFDLYGTVQGFIKDTFGTKSTPKFYRKSRNGCLEKVVENLNNNSYSSDWSNFYTQIGKDANGNEVGWYMEPAQNADNIEQYYRKESAKPGFGGAVMISW